MNDTNGTVYDEAFFTKITAASAASARVVVPLVLRLVCPRSVIDIGCAHGAWLKVFREHGTERVRGLDGHHVDRSRLLIEPRWFTPVDLTQPFEIDDRYDLALCLEVAEHLPGSAAPGLVRTLTRAAPIVLFSAAVPGQKGVQHVNEQWPSYWKALFAESGFVRLDPIRRHIWRDHRVQWFYRQNIFLYVSRDAVRQSEVLQAEERLAELDVTYIEFLNRYTTVRGALAELPRLIKEAVTRRMHRATTIAPNIFRNAVKGARIRDSSSV